jgi:hypothetical protein
LQRSEQNGRNRLSSVDTGCLQVGQRTKPS